MLIERECWEKISKIVDKVKDNPLYVDNYQPPRTIVLSTAEVEKLEVYVKAILIGRRVEALEEG